MLAEKSQTNIVYPKVKLADVLAAFWKGIRPVKWQFFCSVIFIILANVLTVAVPVFYKQFFDIIAAPGDKADVAVKLIKIVVQVAVLNGFLWLFYRFFTFFLNSFETTGIARLKQQAYDYLMEHSYSFFASNFTGSLVQRVNRFARAFETLSDRIIWDILPLAVRIVTVIGVVFFINKWISLVLFLWITVFLVFNIAFSRWKLKYDVKVAEVDSKATGYLADTITNQNTIQLFGGQKAESRGYGEVTNEQASITRFSWDLSAIIEGGQSLLGFAAEFLLFYFSIKYWEKGVITVGVFVLLQAYIIALLDQLWGFTRVVRNVYEAYADAKEMTEILLLSHEIEDIPNAGDISVTKGEIKLENLTFSFNQTRKVLENIDLEIKSGEKVALVGPSGAGKTTFVRLLLRFYSPANGRILIDGQDISKVTQESLRKNISMVPQDPVLFHRTLAENIAYGRPGATLEQIKEAARLAHCDEFIKELPKGFETYVGERGVKLSGGERQRVAIARAILKNAPILILDEATSSLDSHSEMLIRDALNSLMAGKTTIVIAHRLSTIQQMDRIIVIDEGKVIEQGSHKELLSIKKSLYKKLWTLQAGGFLNNEEQENGDEVADENIESDEDK